MTKYYKDYFWKDGRPQGLSLIPNYISGKAYKIVSDPYYKWITIELYQDGLFASLIYDNQLLNFRHLNSANQMAWEKKMISDVQGKVVSQIRNQDDRLVYLETYQFEKDLCRKCDVSSPHGLLLACHQMFYMELGDAINGVVLFDANQHPVMYKTYEWDPAQREFTELLQETWDMEGQMPNFRFAKPRAEGPAVV